MTLRRILIQYTGKRSLNEYKNMHYSLHHTRVVRAIVSGLVTIFSGGGGGGGGGGGRVNEALSVWTGGINPYGMSYVI